MSPEQERDRGTEAKLLLENDLLNGALDAIEAEVLRQWEECPARDTEGRETIWLLYKTTKKFRRLLTGYVETGKMAQENMRRFEESRLKGLLRRIA
jgi:hypothetical protein